MRTRDLLSRGLVLLAMLGAAAPAAAQSATPTNLSLRLDGRDLLVEVGPFDLAANQGHVQLPAFHGTLPADGWLHGFSIEMLDANGRAVPRQTLHHVNVITPDRRELFSQIMLRVAAAGQESGPVSLPRLLGYQVRRGQELIVTSMVHNPTARAYRGVKLRLRFPFTPGDATVKPVTVIPFYLDEMPPASLHSWDLPAGRSIKAWEGRPAVAARILAVGGHLHQYGTALRLEDVTARKVLWEGRPTVDRDGEVTSMPTTRFLMRLGVPVRPDHVYRLVAEYDNPTGQTIPAGGMGAFGGVVIPDDEGRWPRRDPNNAEAKLDWHLVHTGNPNGHSHGGGAHGAMAGMNHGSMPGMDHGSMPGMSHDAMPGMDHGAPGHTHGAAAKPAGTAPRPAAGTKR